MKIICEHHQSVDAAYSSKTIRSIFEVKLLKIAPIRFAFRPNLSTSAIHRRCGGDSLEQIAGWLEGYENQTLFRIPDQNRLL